ncbi:MAG: T9SS type A sorting domain-containing protein [Bacteroidales bacterium]|nr:T9SS type A sorting domain-containing protein [Bacteroidales bacterium]
MLLVGVANAQNYLSMNITEIQQNQLFEFCVSDYDSIIFTKDPSCNNQVWWGARKLNGQLIQEAYDELVLIPNSAIELEIVYFAEGCNINYRVFYVIFHDFDIEPWTQDYIWKRVGSSVTLIAPQNPSMNDLQYEWSTGLNGYIGITVTDPGTYWVHIYNDCGELYDTIEVRDNVEIALATCDLESNLNMVTWSTTEEQAEYVDHLNVKRDGMIVNTANYSDGAFIDNIGSDAAARTYTLIAVATDGTECPIESYQKETIHMAYLMGINSTIEVNWNSPTGYELVGYNICEWNPRKSLPDRGAGERSEAEGLDGDLTIIDFVGAGVNTYTCSEDQFDGGMVVVQGVEASKTENRLLSNRSKDYIGIDEITIKNLKVYPNPSDCTFTVEGTSQLTIYNILGQVITTSHDKDGIHKFTLNPGLYFVKSGEGITKKVVVQ